MTEQQRALALAALDPNAAVQAVDAPAIDGPDVYEVVLPQYPVVKRKGLTLAVEVEPPAPYRRWRFFLFYCLIKLAAWVYPFQFEIYRTAKPWEREEQ